jgi:hypothetical protein
VTGTWNILTMLKPGKIQEIAKQIQNTTLQIVALQEIRWKGYGHIRKKIIHSTIVVIQIQQANLAQAFWLRKE